MRFSLFVRFAKIPRAAFPLFPLGLARAALRLLARVTLARAATLGFARSVVHLAQGTAQRFDFALIGELLALGHFDELQNFFHLIHRVLERFDDLHHLVNRLMDGGSAMLGLRTAHPLGQTLDAFEQRTDRLWCGAGRKWFQCRFGRSRSGFRRCGVGGRDRSIAGFQQGLRLRRTGGSISLSERRLTRRLAPSAAAPTTATAAVAAIWCGFTS